MIGRPIAIWRGNRPGFVHYTVGLHPCAVNAEREGELGLMPAFWREGAVRRWPWARSGWTGFICRRTIRWRQRIFGWQREAFTLRLELAQAKSLDCPVVIHSRGAFAECVEMIDASGVDWTKVVFHCFTETEAEMAELLPAGAAAAHSPGSSPTKRGKCAAGGEGTGAGAADDGDGRALSHAHAASG
jgi:Tat protein secretion system quality control protein TatD with DNase activity